MISTTTGNIWHQDAPDPAPHATLGPAAMKLWEAVSRVDQPLCPQWELLNEQERSLLQAAADAHLPNQMQLMYGDVRQRLCREFARETGYTLLGRRIDGPQRIASHPMLVTIAAERPSRSIPAGPCVFSFTPIESYRQRLPNSVVCALAEARRPVPVFVNLVCAEPIVRRRWRDGRLTYCQSLAEVRAMMQPRTYDPLVLGSLPGAPEYMFCLAHWD